MNPESGNKPIASILITAFNRKEYIISAVKSVLNQTLDHKLYEIIISKNFVDDDIDSFLKQNNCITIFDSKEGIGIRLSGLISAAKSDILIFLEDDDMFYKNKIEYIVKLFGNYNLLYINNSYVKIDKDGNLIPDKKERHKSMMINDFSSRNKKLLCLYEKKEYFGMSNVSIKKESFKPFINYLKDVEVSPDLFFFLVMSLIDGNFLFLEEKLTMYRIHNSLSNIKGDLQQFQKKRSFFWNSVMKDLLFYSHLFESKNSPKVVHLINSISFESRVHIYLSSNSMSKKFNFNDIKESIKIFSKEKTIFYAKLCIIVVMSYFAPKISKRLYYYVLR
ncbi:MAG: glycosyltransferase [Candidatus Thermoplasmatota archaeon]|nr:glycosyltransferase [Candidatus Thermoplasmatota archaeon]